MVNADINRVLALTRNINNIANMIDELMMPLKDLMEKKNCSIEEAFEIKEIAEDYLKHYGAFTLTSTTKAIDKIVKEQHQ